MAHFSKGDLVTYGPVLTPSIRSEIEDLLRASSDGLSHGAVFRLMEQGLDTDEIARARGVGAAGIKTWMVSLEHLFTGTIPTTKSMALKNSYVYRHFLNHDLSSDLSGLVMARLSALKDVNSEVSMGPLNTRSHQYGTKQQPKAPREQSPCTSCAELGLHHVGDCF